MRCCFSMCLVTTPALVSHSRPCTVCRKSPMHAGHAYTFDSRTARMNEVERPAPRAHRSNSPPAARGRTPPAHGASETLPASTSHYTQTETRAPRPAVQFPTPRFPSRSPACARSVSPAPDHAASMHDSSIQGGSMHSSRDNDKEASSQGRHMTVMLPTSHGGSDSGLEVSIGENSGSIQKLGRSLEGSALTSGYYPRIVPEAMGTGKVPEGSNLHL